MLQESKNNVQTDQRSTTNEPYWNKQPQINSVMTPYTLLGF
jgi:hypothetical protein